MMLLSPRLLSIKLLTPELKLIPNIYNEDEILFLFNPLFIHFRGSLVAFLLLTIFKHLPTLGLN